MPTVDLSAFARLKGKLAALKAHDYTPLMVKFEAILRDDNARGMLAGLDKYDRPMPPTKRQQSPGTSRRAGTGPPLAPHRRESRSIKDAVTGHGRAGAEWFAVLAWEDFTTADGRQILPMHAHPRNAPYPRRDVIGVRPTAMNKAREAARSYVRDLLKRI